jgi:restriction system protein
MNRLVDKVAIFNAKSTHLTFLFVWWVFIYVMTNGQLIMNLKNLEDFVAKTVEISSTRDYWFVRTDGGELYEAFSKHNFIAIGWDQITVEEIERSFEKDENLKLKIARLSKHEEDRRSRQLNEKFDPDNVIDLTTKSGKGKATTIAHKLQAFYKLTKGDVVVIPSYGTNILSFGVIADDKISTNLHGDFDVPYRKRRKVKWVVKDKDFDDLDGTFYALKKSMHAISSVKYELAEHIDRLMNDVFFKDGYGHYVIRVKKKEDVSATDLFSLGNDLLELLRILNRRYNFNEPIAETIVKINIQSEGEFVLKGRIGKSIVALSLAVSLIACESPNDNYEAKTKEEKELIDKIKSGLDTLQVHVRTRQ